MSKRIFSPREADTLIVALTSEQAIGAINQAMRVRKVELTLDYSHKDHQIRLYARMPGAEEEVWMLTNTRTKVCYSCTFRNADLQLFANDVKERLAKIGADLFVVGGKKQRSAPEAKLQLNVHGARDTALTLARVKPGAAVLCPHFITPEGKVP